MKIKTAELTGHALDYAVAKCERWLRETTEDDYISWVLEDGEGEFSYGPSSCWSQGGPIIEREQIDLYCNREGQWLAAPQQGIEYMGPTPLIAAMRCYVASKLGDTVDVPEELL